MKVRQVIPDWLKGWAIVLMVYGHITHLGSLAAYQKQIVEIIYTFHIPIFLIISGFFFNTKKEPYEVGKKLASRILRPYLIFISLYLIALALIQRTGIPTSNAPPTSIIDFLDIVFLHPRGAYWFLHSLLVIQLCLVFSNMIAAQAKLDESLAVVIALCFLGILCSYGILRPQTALYFLLGVALARFGLLVPAAYKTGLILTAVIWILAGEDIFSFSFTQVAWSLSIMAFLSGIANLIATTSIVSIFTWFGRNSLVVLVLHSMFIVLLKPSSSLFLKVDPSGLTYSAVVVITTTLGCMLAAFVFDKIRASPYLFGDKAIYSRFKPNSP